jgi:hypothetical protein
LEPVIEPIAQKFSTSLQGGEKRFIIKQVWGNGDVSGKDDIPARTMLSDRHLKLIYEWLCYKYQAQEVRMADPVIVSLVTEEQGQTDASMMGVVQMLDELALSKYYILPIHSDKPLHWTFLCLCKAGQGKQDVIAVEYTDFLIDISDNLARAKLLWKLLVPEGGALFQNLSQYRQKSLSNDCGLGVWYVLEQKMKVCRGEKPWSIYPRPDEYRKTLQGLLSLLKKEYTKWKEEEKKDKSKTIILLPGTAAVNKEEHNKALKLLQAEGRHIIAQTSFASCSSCRYAVGGCKYCNLLKLAEYEAHKQAQKSHAENAMKKALQLAKDLGVIVEDLFKTAGSSAAPKTGGGEGTPNKKHILII